MYQCLLLLAVICSSQSVDAGYRRSHSACVDGSAALQTIVQEHEWIRMFVSLPHYSGGRPLEDVVAERITGYSVENFPEFLLCELTVDAGYRISHSACVDGSAALQTIVQEQKDWIQTFVSIPTYSGQPLEDVLVERITGYNVENFPDDLLCDLTGITSQKQLTEKLHEMGYLENIFRLAYDYTNVFMAIYYQRILDMLEHPQYAATDADREQHSAMLEHRRLLKKSGLMDMDNEGAAYLFDLVIEAWFNVTAWQSIDVVETNDQLYDVAYQITEILIKILERRVEDLSESYEDPEGKVREDIARWTGIVLPTDPRDIKAFINVATVQVLLESRQGFNSVYSMLYDNEFFHHLMPNVYSGIGYRINTMINSLSSISEEEDASSNQSGATEFQISEQSWLKVFVSIRSMGFPDLPQ